MQFYSFIQIRIPLNTGFFLVWNNLINMKLMNSQNSKHVKEKLFVQF